MTGPRQVAVRFPNRTHHLFRQRTTRRRRGAVLVAALLCILVVSIASLTMVRRSLQQHYRLRQAAWDSQAAWLLSAGVSRAQAQLRTNPEYAGDTWEISSERLRSEYGGRVVTEITRRDDNSPRQVRIQVFYPDQDHMRVRRERVFELAVPQGEAE